MSKFQYNNIQDFSYIKSRYTNIFDITETPNYGLIDNFGNKIEIKKSKLGVSTKYNVILVEDIVPLFEEMMEYIENLFKKQLITRSDTFLGDLKPYNLYVDPAALEMERVRNVTDSLKSYSIKYNINWKNFYEFLEIFLGILAPAAPHASPVPAPPHASPMPSARCALNSCPVRRPVLDCGLGVGLARNVRASTIYNDKYLDTFVSVSKYFGFMIHFHEPTKLIFNIRSEALQIPLDRVFDYWYNGFIEGEMERAYYFLVTIYDILKKENPFHQRKKFNGCRTDIRLLDKDDAPKISEVDLKKLYFEYQLALNKIYLSDFDKKRQLKLINHLSEKEAVEYVNSFLQTNKI